MYASVDGSTGGFFGMMGSFGSTFSALITLTFHGPSSGATPSMARVFPGFQAPSTANVIPSCRSRSTSIIPIALAGVSTP